MHLNFAIILQTTFSFITHYSHCRLSCSNIQIHGLNNASLCSYYMYRNFRKNAKTITIIVEQPLLNFLILTGQSHSPVSRTRGIQSYLCKHTITQSLFKNDHYKYQLKTFQLQNVLPSVSAILMT